MVFLPYCIWAWMRASRTFPFRLVRRFGSVVDLFGNIWWKLENFFTEIRVSLWKIVKRPSHIAVYSRDYIGFVLVFVPVIETLKYIIRRKLG